MNELAKMCDALGMEADNDRDRLWHVLYATLEHCDAAQPRLDFAEMLANVRADLASARLNDKPKAREPQVSMMMGGFGTR